MSANPEVIHAVEGLREEVALLQEEEEELDEYIDAVHKLNQIQTVRRGGEGGASRRSPAVRGKRRRTPCCGSSPSSPRTTCAS